MYISIESVKKQPPFRAFFIIHFTFWQLYCILDFIFFIFFIVLAE